MYTYQAVAANSATNSAPPNQAIYTQMSVISIIENFLLKNNYGSPWWDSNPQQVISNASNITDNPEPPGPYVQFYLEKLNFSGLYKDHIKTHSIYFKLLNTQGGIEPLIKIHHNAATTVLLLHLTESNRLIIIWPYCKPLHQITGLSMNLNYLNVF